MGRRDQLSHDALVGVHVLVVDDDADARDLFRTVLEYCGALVTVVPSADEALAVLARVRPDVLVTDIAMPIHEGYWLVEHVRSRTLAAGFQAHLKKPLDPWELCRVLASLTLKT